MPGSSGGKESTSETEANLRAPDFIDSKEACTDVMQFAHDSIWAFTESAHSFRIDPTIKEFNVLLAVTRNHTGS